MLSISGVHADPVAAFMFALVHFSKSTSAYRDTELTVVASRYRILEKEVVPGELL
ncbi:unannotated protein [freshwater metagenome]|uniref:Unannotated protein n=1 Tax=freshwater metagenome TaxID=449393 RepID=A0A6J6E4K9_9ZZZZ